VLICLIAPPAKADEQRSITGPYKIGDAGNNDCHVRIVAGGGAFYKISADPAAAYRCPQGGEYVVTVTNIDPMPDGTNATGAKIIDFVSCFSGEGVTYLWPQQTIEIAVIGSSWIPVRCPGLWQIPLRGFVLQFDPVNGSDDWGAADGLAGGARAFKSMNNALEMALQNFMALTGTMTVRCTYNEGGCSRQTDAQPVHWAPHDGAPLGLQGRAAVTLDCTGATMASYSGFFAASIVESTNCNWAQGVAVSEGALFEDVGGGNAYCATPSGAIFATGFHSYMWLSKEATICSGTVKNVVLNTNGTFINASLMKFTGPLAVQETVDGEGGSYTAFGETAGGPVKGRKWKLGGSSFISDSAHVPGSAPGSTCATCGTD